MNPAEIDAVARVLVSPQRLPNPALVGKSATFIAAQCGLSVPPDTRVLIAPLAGVGRDYPLSIEKLCPVLSYYVVRDWQEGCERCKQILRYGGMGHTMSIHSRNEQVILEFGLKKPAFRIIVNSPTTHGSIGLTTGLDPAMTLGCGGYGGNITSDNISPQHLLNVKRLAYEISPAQNRFERAIDTPAGYTSDNYRPAVPAAGAPGRPALPSAPPRPSAPAGISADALTARIDQFLQARGIRSGIGQAPPPPPRTPERPAEADRKVLDFVSEEDVRLALKAGTKILVSERAIITPAARDLGEQHRVFSIAPWRG
jgi:acetaldehyde dehydrogenase (acetylating)